MAWHGEGAYWEHWKFPACFQDYHVCFCRDVFQTYLYPTCPTQPGAVQQGSYVPCMDSLLEIYGSRVRTWSYISRNWVLGRLQFDDFEFAQESRSCGSFHSIRLVESVSHKSISASFITFVDQRRWSHLKTTKLLQFYRLAKILYKEADNVQTRLLLSDGNISASIFLTSSDADAFTVRHKSWRQMPGINVCSKHVYRVHVLYCAHTLTVIFTYVFLCRRGWAFDQPSIRAPLSSALEGHF